MTPASHGPGLILDVRRATGTGADLVQTIAVVIATYNRAELAVSAARSALSQFPPEGWARRVVLVDDGSTDDTVDRLRATFALTPADGVADIYWGKGICLISGPNRERGAARNRGASVAVAHGGADWFLFLDSDDELAPDALAGFIGRLRKVAEVQGGAAVEDVDDSAASRPVALYANLREMSANGALAPPFFRASEPEGDILAQLLVRQLLSPGSTLVCGQAFWRVGAFSEDRAMSGSEDWHLWARLAMAGDILYAPHVAYHYRRHEGSTPAERFADSVILSRTSVEELLAESRPDLLARLRRAMWVRAYLVLAGTFNSCRQPAPALRRAFSALVCDPRLALRAHFWRLIASILWRAIHVSRVTQ